MSPEMKAEPGGPRPLRLLVVEDHEDCLMMMSMLLEMLGHQVTPARSIASAIEAASNSTFDCVISDLGLPDGSGHQLMRTLKEGSSIRGIALSGSVGDDDVRESMRSGFQRHLAKPVEAKELEDALAALSGDLRTMWCDPAALPLTDEGA